MNDITLYLNQLKKIHRIQLDIALEIKRICNKYDIKYSLIAGTLLGAVRHQGFVPWDDDLDIGMLRSEYDKFIEIAKNELSDEYFLQTWDTDKEFGMPFAKVRKNGTIFVEKNSSKTDQHKGIYIDIFPFDTVPTNKIAKRLHNIRTYLLKRVLIGKLGYEVWDNNEHFKKITYKLINFIFKPFSLEFIKKILKREMLRYKNVNSKYVVAIGGSYGYERETIKKEWLEDLQVLEFEKNQFTVPVKYQVYLRNLYGDYMSLPPKDKRYNRHKIIKIDFGEGTS